MAPELEDKDISIAAAMFLSINDLLTEFDLTWDSVTAIGVHNTNSNTGEHSSIASRANEKNNIVVAGCL